MPDVKKLERKVRDLKRELRNLKKNPMPLISPKDWHTMIKYAKKPFLEALFIEARDRLKELGSDLIKDPHH
jgi:hypothetical protein